MEVEKAVYKDFINDMKKENREGLVLCGTGGDLDECVNGVTEYLHNNVSVTSKNPDDVWDRVIVFETTSANPKRDDMLMLFKKSGEGINLGKLAIVRIRMNDEITRTSWLSDYVVNFKRDHK